MFLNKKEKIDTKEIRLGIITKASLLSAPAKRKVGKRGITACLTNAKRLKAVFFQFKKTTANPNNQPTASKKISDKPNKKSQHGLIRGS
ncbi:hypothetical protein [Enterococcus lemanii]|uniref:Uncharacterized protein n=1 Tax=Enterococcus lemanii TaxID=1159752 RepID=A0ABV9N0V6_9ENTE|nr:hypothetical protein [Enterococcus lemanii]MBM7710199.1 aldehyde:ferredoxin oxidoreductase [Enterococcus lemanii]